MELEYEFLVGSFVKRITKPFQSFCIDKVIQYDGGKKKYFDVKGNNLPKLTGITIKYWGHFEKSSYGEQFNAVTWEIIAPKKERGIRKYLSSKLFPEINKNDVKVLVDRYGDQTLDLIETEPEKIREVLGEVKGNAVINTYMHNKAASKVFDILSKYGVSQEMTFKLYKKYDNKIFDYIKLNPYRLNESGLAFNLCENIAIGEGVALDSYERIDGHLCNTLKAQERGGSVFFDVDAIKQATLRSLNSNAESSVGEERFNEVFNQITSNKKDVALREYQNGTKIIASMRGEVAERNIAGKIKYLMSKEVSDKFKKKVEKEVENFNKVSTLKLSEGQKEAVKRSLENHFSVITGGPGTGKTTILKAIIYVYERVFSTEVTLMAPTGKAAVRMSESTGKEARTIHSRVGIRVGEENSDVNPINYGLVIVDETSMIDLYTMEKLMKAISSNECHVIFCGDIDQLPSVGCGCVLQSMIESGTIPTSRLTEVFRQQGGSAIVDNAYAINRGEPKEVTWNDSDFILLKADSEEQAKEIILDVFKTEADEIGIKNVALLSAYRQVGKANHIVSSDGLNPLLQDIMNPVLNEREVYKFNKDKREFRVGDRVIQWENCDTSANGDTGTIEKIYEDEDGDVLFDIVWDNGSFVEGNTLSDMESITLGYSMSIHKSQGSEYKTVIIPMLTSQVSTSNFFARNLIYTGVTRAKCKVIIVGDEKAFSKCCIRTSNDKRKSLLGLRLSMIKSA